MRTAKAIREIISNRGRRGLPLEGVYRMLYNPELYMIAYGKIYRNKGATTPGVTGETVDGMSLDKIKAIIELLRYERYKWSPARRVQIPKVNGKKRPLGIPPWSDKLLQEVMRMVLEAYYEPKFSDRSHGFRPGKGCHTALREIYETWKGTCWFVEGDIKGCFDHIDHDVLLGIIRKSIHDERFIRLLSEMLKAGYMEEWTYGKTLSGTPQGGIISPILANIYMNELDQHMEQNVLPKWNKGEIKAKNPIYHRYARQATYWYKKGHREKARQLRKIQKTLPTQDTNDPDYRRLRYIRYADDFILGFTGTKKEAEQIKEELREYLAKLKLELSEAKTLVTHARTEKAKFLGYELHTLSADTFRSRDGRRLLNGTIALDVPKATVEQKIKPYVRNGKSVHRREMAHDEDYTIIAAYQNVYRGIVNYWKLARNLHSLSKLEWMMEQSLVKTLANKHRLSVRRVYARYSAKQSIGGRNWKILRCSISKNDRTYTAIWGGITLARDIGATIYDNDKSKGYYSRTELAQRTLANECEWCGSRIKVEVHHVRGLRDLKKHKGSEMPAWKKLMIARARKTMVVCRTCHEDIEHGRPLRNPPSGEGFMFGKTKRSLTVIYGTGEPDAVKSRKSGSVGG